LNKII